MKTRPVLTEVSVVVRNPTWRTNGKGQPAQRTGYKDEHGQVYLPPKNEKRARAWQAVWGVS